MSAIKYRPEIDGLRAFAVIPVILFHLGAQWLPGGFIGVDVFFVISGFLITSIILKDFDNGTFKFIDFWLRRVRRIYPALLVMIFTTSIAGYYLLYAPDSYDLGSQGIASILSYANIYFWRLAGDYWGPKAENSAYLHTWSLSVEEQFYLIYPFLIIFLLKFYKKYVVFLISMFIALSLLIFLYGTLYYSSATFYLLPTRAWELGSGCLLAIMKSSNYKFKTKHHSKISSFGLVIIILSYIFISGENGISAYLFVPVIGSLLVIAFAETSESMVCKFLSFSPIVYIGKMSYSLYIWHWPVIVLLKNVYLDGKILFTPLYAILITFLISLISYHFVEKKTRQKFNIIKPIFLFFIITIVFSLFLYTSNLVEDTSAYNKTTWNGQLYNVAQYKTWSDSIKKRMNGITVSAPKTSKNIYYTEGGIVKLYNKKTPEVVVLGDSHALMWSSILDEITKEMKVSISFYAADGSQTFFEIPIKRTKKMEDSDPSFDSEGKYIFNKMRLHFLKRWKPKLVIISTRWDSIKDEKTTRDLMFFLDSIGSKVLLVEQPPTLFFGEKNTPQYLAHMNFIPIQNRNAYISSNNSPEYKEGLSLIRQISKAHKNVEIIPITDIFMNKNKVWVLDGSDVLYIDDDHLSQKGALKAKNRIKQKLQKYFQGE